MKWPWQKPEIRSSTSYTSLVASGQAAYVNGEVAGNAGETAALEAAAQLYGNCFSAARLTPDIPALTPALRMMIARALIRDGEIAFRISARNGRLALLPVGSFQIVGPPGEENWIYQIDENGPTATITTIIPGPGIIHCRYSTTPQCPWKGLSPLQVAKSTGKLAGSLELRLSEETNSPSGYYLPYPQDPDAVDGSDNDKLMKLRGDIAAAGGRQVMVQTTQGGLDEGRMNAPATDFKPSQHRFGAHPPDVLQGLRSDAARGVLSACAVPVSLFDEDSAGTAQKESWRRFGTSSCAGMAAIISEEISNKLGVDVIFDFSNLMMHDVVGRAAAFKSMMMTGEVDVTKALNISGLMSMDNDD